MREEKRERGRNYECYEAGEKRRGEKRLHGHSEERNRVCVHSEEEKQRDDKREY